MICEICLKDEREDDIAEFTKYNIKICRNCHCSIKDRTCLEIILRIVIYSFKNRKRLKAENIREIEIDFLRKLILK